MVDFEGKRKSIGHCEGENGRIHRQARAALRIYMTEGLKYNKPPMRLQEASEIIDECKSCRAKIRGAIKENPNTTYDQLLVNENLTLTTPRPGFKMEKGPLSPMVYYVERIY